MSRLTAGQHLSEYALVMGVVAIAAISVQYVARRAIQRGAQAASDTVLGPPTARPGCLDTDIPGDGLCNCEDTDLDGVCDALDVQATSTVTETGTGRGRRTTQLDDTVVGRAEGQFVHEIPVPTGRVFGTGGHAVPRPSSLPERDDELPEIPLP